MISAGEPRLTLAVMGPTAAGKTRLAVELARAVRGELINADSRQAIAELTVGVCKPGPAELAGVSCHGLNWRHLGDRFTVADFVQLAARQMDDCRSRGLVPILVGGSGLYIRALLEGFDFGSTGDTGPSGATLPAPDLENALAELRSLAPQRYLEVDRRNPRRVERALALARRGAVASRQAPAWEAVRIGCAVASEALRERIWRRSAQLVGPELEQEVGSLLSSGFPPSLIAGSAIGYAEALAWMAGELTREAAVERLAQRTWRYARRQMTWLRKEPDLLWIDAGAEPDEMLEAALRVIGRAMIKEAN
jgi:tRNA dimethylallyltransferase